MAVVALIVMAFVALIAMAFVVLGAVAIRSILVGKSRTTKAVTIVGCDGAVGNMPRMSRKKQSKVFARIATDECIAHIEAGGEVPLEAQARFRNEFWSMPLRQLSGLSSIAPSRQCSDAAPNGQVSSFAEVVSEEALAKAFARMRTEDCASHVETGGKTTVEAHARFMQEFWSMPLRQLSDTLSVAPSRQISYAAGNVSVGA